MERRSVFKARYTREGPIEQTLRVTRPRTNIPDVILHIEKYTHAYTVTRTHTQ